MRDNVRKTISNHALPLTSDNIYTEIQRDLLQPVFLASMMASDTFLRDWILSDETSGEQMVRYLKNKCKDHGLWTAFCVSNKTGNYYYENGVLKQVQSDSAKDSWYYQLRDSSEPIFIHIDKPLHKNEDLTAFVNFKVKDYEGEFIGAAGIGLSMNEVKTLINEYSERYKRDIYFVRPNGDINLGTSNGIQKKFSNLYEIDKLKEYANDILENKVSEVNFEINGTQYFLYIRYIPETRTFLLVGQNEDIMLEPLRKHIWTNIITALLISSSIAFICFFIINKANKELEEQNNQLLEKNNKIDSQRHDLELANNKLSELNQEKDEFIGIVAHDLKTPLQGIMGLCEIAKIDIEDNSFDPKAFIKDTETTSQRLNDLVQTLLDVCYIEDFNGDIELKTTAIDKHVQAVFSQFNNHAKKKRIRYELELTNKPDLQLDTHPEWLSVCLGNLISNAIKYSQINGEVSLKTSLQNKSYEIAIQDSGPGISELDRKRLFRKFERLSAQPTGGESSTGLGLYIVKKMCDRIGIKIKVESSLRKGSIFKLILPLK